MSRIGAGTVISVGLNIFLSLWLVNNYFYDEPFRNYVNLTFSQFYPFLILTLGVGGGSGLGYILLRKRHPAGPSPRLQKTIRPLRQGGISVSPSGFSQVRGPGSANLAEGAKHTAYAVPPLQKSSPSGSLRFSPPTGISAGSKVPTPSSTPPRRLEPRTDVMSQTSIPSPAPTLARSEEGRFSPPERPQEARLEAPPPSSRISDNVSRIPPSSQWAPQPAPPPARAEPPGPFLKPGMDMPPRSGVTPGPAPGPGSQPSFQPKWQPPESGKPASWVDPVPKQGYAPPPPKWTPPGSQPPGGTGPPGTMPRPGPFPPGRAPFGQPQPLPRPLTFPGAMRPPDPRFAQRPVGPDQPRPPPLMGPPLQRPSIQGARPPLGTSPPSSVAGLPPPSGQSQAPTAPEKPARTTPSAEHSQAASSQPQPAPEGSPTGEMDWDTALDTILKTLRKDKLAEK